MSLWYATGVHYRGYTTTATRLNFDGPGLTLFGPTGLTWTGFHSSITVQTLTPVSGTVVMPLGGCASLFSCITSNEGVDERLPEDYALFQCSFTASTKVTTQQGQQAIGTLKPGEKVLAYNPKTRKMELQPILHVWINQDNDLVDLTLTTLLPAHEGKPATKTSEVMHTNQKHPFLTIEQGFLSVSKIRLGMHIRRADGRVGVVTGWKVVPGVQTMYNLEVQQDHTFVVGDGRWVVHNECSGLGKLASREFPVSEENLGIIEAHLSQPRFLETDGTIAPENAAMIERLRAAFTEGKMISGADASFYFHELSEATFMESGMEYDEAHQAAIDTYGVSPFSIYHPDVIRSFPSLFNESWFAFWGISK